MGSAPFLKEAFVPTAFQVPSSLALCSDLLYTTRQARLELQKQVDELAARETTLKQHLIETFTAEGADQSGVGGKVAFSKLVEKEEPVAQDWEATWKYIAKKKAWDLLQKRLSAPAVKARWENKEEIPGIGRIRVYSISNTKV
jgi:hypothetical protein